jgi:diguanylate cyclase (GGDEF)-like protein
VSLLAVGIGWNSTARVSNLLFVGMLLVYVVVGIRSAARFNARPLTEASARLAAWRLYVALAVLGLIYNLIFLNLARAGVPHALDYQLLILSLFCAGAAASYQHLRGAAVVFIVSSTLPLTLYQFFRGGQNGHVVAVLLMVFMIFMSRVTVTLHHDAIERMKLTRELQAARDEAQRQARTDGLTGLANRTAFFESGRTLLAVARRHDRPLSLVMVDLDHFKSINDRFGHAAGDAFLAAFAEMLRTTRRTSDVCGRIGGEEFALLLPETSAAAAAQLADRLRDSIRLIRIPGVDPEASFSGSFGITELLPGDADVDGMIDRADRALYRAKALGRDRAVIDITPQTARQHA